MLKGIPVFFTFFFPRHESTPSRSRDRASHRVLKK